MQKINFIIAIIVCLCSIAITITGMIYTPAPLLSRILAAFAACAPSAVLLFAASVGLVYDCFDEEEL